MLADQEEHASHRAPAAPGGALRLVLADLRDTVSTQSGNDRVALHTLVATMEKKSFPVLLLLPALLLVSPLSAIPGATSLFGLMIAALLVQYALGRQQIWLPRFVLSKTFSAHSLRRSLDWLDRPVSRLERLLRPRLHWTFLQPLALFPVGFVLVAALCAPVMEVIPASGTSMGAAICIFCAGLLARDGLFVVIGAGLATLLPLTLWIVLL